MKIGIYDPYLDDMGGGEKYMLTIAQVLSLSHDVTLFWNKREDLDIVLQRFSIDLSRVKLAANIFSPKVSFAKRLFESRKYDALIVLTDGSIPIVLSKKLFIHAQQPIPGVKKSLKDKFKLARVTKVFCNSYYSKSFIDKQLGVNSIVLYPPIEFHEKHIKKENIIMHVGRFRVRNVGMSDYKKQSVMVEEFKKMVKKGLKKWKFVVATGLHDEDKAEFEKLEKSAEGYPIEFLKNRTNNDLWEEYSKAKIYWHASGYGENLEEHPEYAEHFGISTVEAMGAGAVPVVINAGGQKEIIENGLNGFLWDSLEDLKEKTLMLTQEDVILSKMAKEAGMRAKDFSGTRFADEVKSIVENG